MTTQAPEGYVFDYDWFSMHIPYLERLFAENDIRHVLEIGSWEGRSSVWFLEQLRAKEQCSLTCVDTWAGGEEHAGADMEEVYARFLHNTRLSGGNVGKLRMRSVCALSRLVIMHRAFDLIYVDGSHQAPDVLTDLVLSVELLRPGGFLICDDYAWDSPDRNPLREPKIAIDCFDLIFSERMEQIEGDPSQRWFRKL